MERNSVDRHQQMQEEVQEIANVLAREAGKTPAEVWQEALTLHRIRYEPEPGPDTEVKAPR
ncbi:MAG: hypothetical protein NVSMB52_01950 [Chloroflexota bacterium]